MIPKIGSWIDRSIQIVDRCEERLPVHHVCTLPFGFSSDACAKDGFHGACIQEFESLQVPPNAGQLLKLLRGECLGDVSPIGLQEWGCGRHFHLLLDVPYLQRSVELRRLIYLDAQLIRDRLCKSRSFDGNFVCVRNQLSLRVLASVMVVTSNVVPLLRSVIVTLAFATAEPLGSVTVPMMLPNTCWARASAGERTRKTAAVNSLQSSAARM
jgi:hypothetical protein